jgi:hypothetical protein
MDTAGGSTITTKPDTAPIQDNAKILLDAPAVELALGFEKTAQALSRLIEASSPQFAVGVFGGWGSGKTTLMRSIKKELSPAVVTVEFNAWRYEREASLLVPLLDTVRAALVEWGKNTQDTGVRERVQRAARRVGRVIRGLAAGLSGEVGLPGAVKVGYNVAKAIDAVTMKDDPDQPQSLYVAAFQELSEAFAEFTSHGTTRVVVFVDDLDRCLPGNALEVLESMKLFFDLPGFIFVVGLDEEVIQRAIQSRFRDSMPINTVPAVSPIPADPVIKPINVTPGSTPGSILVVSEGKLARDYVEKIFQVPYRLPPIIAAQLGDLLKSMYLDAKLPPAQLDDFQNKVEEHLKHVAVARRINPREVKRFLNNYTLQMLVRPDLDRNTVLTLQTLSFRHDWRTLYDAILTDSILFMDALNRYRAGDDLAFEDLAPDLSSIPKDLGEYLRSAIVGTLPQQNSLEAYLSSLESTSPTPTWLRECYRAIGKLRSEIRRVRQIPGPKGPDGHQLAGVVKETVSQLRPYSQETRGLLLPYLEDMEAVKDGLVKGATPEASDEAMAEVISTAWTRLYDLSDQIYKELGRLREALLTPTP